MSDPDTAHIDRLLRAVETCDDEEPWNDGEEPWDDTEEPWSAWTHATVAIAGLLASAGVAAYAVTSLVRLLLRWLLG